MMVNVINKKERNICIDILKIIAIIMVIASHTKGFYISINEIAVPLFLVITGYNYANSITKNSTSFKQYYKFKYLIGKIFRFLFPFFILMIIEVFVIVIYSKFDTNDMINILFLGGYGPGSYYTPLLMQIILIFPFIYYLVRKNKVFVNLFLLITILFEFLINIVTNCDSELVTFIYRITVFRQLFYIACGCYISFYKGKLEHILAIIYIAIGTTFFALLDFNVYKPILFKRWLGTTIPFGVLAIGVFYLLINHVNKKHNNQIIKLFSNSTYHIFLIQQFFFWIDKYIFLKQSDVIFNILICCIVGSLFFMLENRVRKIKKSNNLT